MSAKPNLRNSASRLSLLFAALALFAAATFIALTQDPRPDPWKSETGWEAFYYPVERDAFMRLSRVSENLHDVFVVPDTGEFWIVGSSGLILHSLDLGRTWMQTGLNENGVEISQKNLHSVFFSDDGKQGRIVSSDGEFLLTKNGGISWTVYTSNITENFADTHFLADGLRGWATTSNYGIGIFASIFSKWSGVSAPNNEKGGIFNTTDGGKTWKSQATGEDFNSLYIHADGMHGWAVGRQGAIFSTIDGGKNWQKKNSGTIQDLNKILFLKNSLQGWIVGDEGTILATTDGGTNWHTQISGTVQKFDVIHFHADGLHGWVAGINGSLFVTVDGGKTWQPRISANGNSFTSVKFLGDNLHGLAVGGEAILLTYDGGKTWQPQTLAYKEDIDNAWFLSDGLHGWAVGRNGIIFATTDGGNTWQMQNSGYQHDLKHVQFLEDGVHGWAIAERNFLLATSNGGNTWEIQAIDNSIFLNCIQFHSDGKRGWVVGSDGIILTTMDGGKTWQLQNSGTKEGLESVQFLYDGLRGWAVGNSGTILSTLDGGKTWLKQKNGGVAVFFGVHFLADGLRGWVVGNMGTIVATDNGGKTWWTQESSKKDEAIIDVQFLADGLSGWAAGSNGTLLATKDGGNTWSPQKSGTREWLGSVQFLEDGLHGWAAGYKFNLLTTTDGGKTWKNPIQYHRYPAPWYWLVCFISLTLAWQGAKYRPVNAPQSIADLLASDRPLRAGDKDALGYADTALGVSRFLRNPRTEPPLTLAVTGAWGTGKSSLMNLLRADLRRAGFATVWFNAWHHQKGEQMLAALSASLRTQAIPRFFSLAGLRFRLNLLSRRGIRHWFWALGLATVAAYGVFSHAHLAAFLAQLADREGGWLADGGKALLQSIPVLAGLVSLVAVLYQASQGFGLDPAKLIASVSAGKGQAASLDPGARFRFAQEFEDVTAALAPGRLVIFIDDLDRCSKENVVEVLENLNFLASSGDCFIVLGMVPTWVETCVALGFKELAQENSDGLDEGQHRAHRREFAREYLEKLINIEVPLPKLETDKAKSLLPQQAATVDAPRSLWAKAWDAGVAWLRAYRNVLTIAGLLAAGSVFGWLLQTPLSGWLDKLAAPPPAAVASELPVSWNALGNGPLSLAPKPGGESGELVLRVDAKNLDKGVVVGKLGDKNGADLVLKRPAAPKPEAAPAPPKPVSNSAVPPPKPEPGDQDAPRFTPGLENTAPAAPWLPVGPGVVLAGLVLWLLLRRPVELTNDSERFVDALNDWHRVIAHSCPTPRLLKRYLNWVRFLAMRYRPMEMEKPGLWSKLPLFRKLKPPAEATGPSEDEAFDEKILVALSAIYQFRKDWVTNLAKFEEIQNAGVAIESLMSGMDQLNEIDRLAEKIKQKEDMKDEWAKPMATQQLMEKHTEQTMRLMDVKEALASLTTDDWKKAGVLRQRFMQIAQQESQKY